MLQFKLKGEIKYTEGFPNVEKALLHAPSLAVFRPGDIVTTDFNYCDQEGCIKPPVVTYRLKQEFTKDMIPRFPVFVGRRGDV